MNHFNNQTESFLDHLKLKFFELFNLAIAETSYGMVPQELIEKHNGNEEKANREFFDSYTQEDVFEKSRLLSVSYDNDEAPGIHYNISFEVDWEMEHGILVCISEGEIYSID